MSLQATEGGHERHVLTSRIAQDYLETKRMAFPRFYFVAPADLLDILSKGSNPQAIVRCGGAAAAAADGCIPASCPQWLKKWHVLRGHSLPAPLPMP